MIWENGDGQELEITSGDGSPPGTARITTRRGRNGNGWPFYADPGDLVAIAIQLFQAAGQPAPVITPRPDVDPRAGYDFGPVRFRVNPRARGVDVQEGVSSWHWAPSVCRQVAGCLVALADAAESEPDPGEVEALAGVLRASSVFPEPLPPMYPDLGQLARAVLLAGWKREAGDA